MVWFGSMLENPFSRYFVETDMSTIYKYIKTRIPNLYRKYISVCPLSNSVVYKTSKLEEIT